MKCYQFLDRLVEKNCTDVETPTVLGAITAVLLKTWPDLASSIDWQQWQQQTDPKHFVKKKLDKDKSWSFELIAPTEKKNIYKKK